VDFVVLAPAECGGFVLDVLTANDFRVVHIEDEVWSIVVSRRQIVNRRHMTLAGEEVDALVKPFGARLVLTHVLWSGRQRLPRRASARRATLLREKQRILAPCSTIEHA
jgi:hypothetical protein